MKNFIKSIRTAQAAKGKGSKQAKVDAISNLTDDGKRLMFEALSPYRVFGVKKFPMPEEFNDTDVYPESFLYYWTCYTTGK